jgi:hypothetical protein
MAAAGVLSAPRRPVPIGGGRSSKEAMKPLVAILGKDQVKRIVDLLG